MKLGVWIPNCRHLATSALIRATAVRAEQLGYESVWVSDHVVVPHANVVNFGETIFDPLVTLAVIAGATARVRLGTTRKGKHHDPKDPKDPAEPQTVIVCHQGTTIEVSVDDLQAHLDHGDTTGPCEN